MMGLAWQTYKSKWITAIDLLSLIYYLELKQADDI